MTVPGAPQHIAFFLPAMNSGGAEKTVLMLTTQLAELGIKTDLLLVKKQGAYVPRIHPSVRVIELSQKGMVRSLFPLIKYLKSEQPNCLISGLPGPCVIAMISKYMLGKKRARKTKFVLTQHSPFSLNGIESKKIRTKIRTALARLLYKKADHAIAVSNGVAQDLSKNVGLPLSKITTIHNPIDLQRIEELSSQNPDHPWLNDPAIKTIISVGRLDSPKDYPTLLKALAKTPEIKLLICGEGPDRQTLEELINQLGLQDRVQLLGFVDNIYAKIAAADLLVLSSRYEGFGNVLIEAMAVGTQIVATDCPHGPAEITKNGKQGRLAKISDAESLKAAITQTLENPLQTPAYLKAEAQNYSLEKIAEEYLKVINLRE